MPPKKGTKRKANGTAAAAATKKGELAGPDRNVWPGWVEMESEPAFFNVMLRDMGVRGVRVQEVYSMDPDILATLSQPVHGFIFLFRYRNQDEQDPDTGSNQDHIWFANQIPDFACASVAMLNIVNNIPGLEMGEELRDFKKSTQDKTPMKRGDDIDNFEFVKRIHNSFATENDILNANMHRKAKVDKFKKKQAAAKAAETKRAKKAAQEAAKKAQTPKVEKKPTRTSTRAKNNAKGSANASTASTPKSKASSRSTKRGPDDDFDPDDRKAKKPKVNGVKKEDEAEDTGVRRSGRARNPPKDVQAAKEEEDLDNEGGFHFIAYMPIGDHVWKLDGMDKYPTDMGSFGEGGNGADGGTGNWRDAVSPVIMQRMEEMQGADIEFNLMAIVHDPALVQSKQLLENIKTLQAVDTKLDGVFEDWREMEGAETLKDVVTGMSVEFAITQADIDDAELPSDKEEEITEEDGLLELIEYRQKVIAQQKYLRISLRDAMESDRDDDEKARHRRHDYVKFVRSWLSELAARQVLGDLFDLNDEK